MKKKLPSISGLKLVKTLNRLGFKVVRRKGSHAILKKNAIILSVPLHKNLKKGTLQAIIKHSRIDIAEFLKFL